MHVTHKLAAAAAAAAAVTLALAVPAVGQTYQTVALSGRPAPGTGAGVNYSFFVGAPVVSVAGQVAYNAVLTGTRRDGRERLGDLRRPRYRPAARRPNRQRRPRHGGGGELRVLPQHALP